MMNSRKDSKPRNHFILASVSAINRHHMVHLEGLSCPLQWQNVQLLPSLLLCLSWEPRKVPPVEVTRCWLQRPTLQAVEAAQLCPFRHRSPYGNLGPGTAGKEGVPGGARPPKAAGTIPKASTGTGPGSLGASTRCPAGLCHFPGHYRVLPTLGAGKTQTVFLRLGSPQAHRTK